MAAYLPADMITIIFSFLPVRFLLQFRSISKSWRFIINSDDFKTLHFNNLHKLNPILVLRHSFKLYAVDLPTLGNAVPLNKSPKLSKYLRGCFDIQGSCNGLLCINNVIWNPSLRKHWILPFPPGTGSSLSSKYGFAGLVSGFGFDSFTGDYKLVEITYFTSLRSSFVSRVRLFSCRTNTWKILPNMPYALHWSKKMGVFVDHALHWVVTKNREFGCPSLIVAFDLRFEVFNEVPLPELGEGFEIQVSQLGGCLSVVVGYHRMSRVDLWVMKQYGSKDGWFKLFTSVETLEFSRPLRCVKKPLGYSSDGMMVLFEHSNKLIWYNIKSKQVTHVTIPGMPNFYDTIIWVESFVQPPFPSEN